jgi:hypothetical protein
MQLRRPFVITGALGLGVLAAALAAVLTSIGHAQAVAAPPVTTTITFDATTFAPPPSNATPTLTAAQAFATWSPGTAIPSDVSVQLGLLTEVVGPYCGAECQNGNIVQGGMVYSALNQLAYGFEWSTSCLNLAPNAPPTPPGGCIQWNFIDANTGHQIIVAYQRSAG